MHIKLAVKIVRLKVYMAIASPKFDYFLKLQYLGQYLSYYIQTWHEGRRIDAIYARARSEDLDLDARSQWVSKGKNISVECSRQLSKQ